MPGDIEWAVDLPAGRQLVEWIAAQLDSNDEDRDLELSLKTIALEPEEAAL